MPAIQPSRLRQQAALLAQYFDQPAAFVRSLHHLLEFYADRARRPGQAGKPPPLISAYNVRPPVLRMLLQEWSPLVTQEPETALALCDALWCEPNLEFRLLAASFLGQIPPDPLEPVLNRIELWVKNQPEERLVVALLTQSLSGLRKENPQRLLELVENWLSSGELYEKRFGLRALLPLVSDPDFENLPIFFRLIQPLSRETPPPLRPDLLDILIALAHRSPQETAFFLRQNLEISNSPDTPWLIRQVINEFPAEQQESLRTAVRGIGRGRSG